MDYKFHISEQQKLILNNIIEQPIESYGIKLVAGDTDYEFTSFCADTILINIDAEHFLKLSCIYQRTELEGLDYFKMNIEQIEESNFYDTEGFCISPCTSDIKSVKVFSKKEENPAVTVEYDSLIVIETEEDIKYCFSPIMGHEDGRIMLTIINPEHHYQNVYDELNAVYNEQLLSWNC